MKNKELIDRLETIKTYFSMKAREDKPFAKVWLDYVDALEEAVTKLSNSEDFRESLELVSETYDSKEHKYRVYVNTGTAWLYPVDVVAYNEQDAVDQVIDMLEEEESSLVTDYYQLEDEMSNEYDSVDEYADAMGLICGGNSGLYISIDRVEEI